MNLKKKGLSNVVSTVMIILLTLVAVGVLAGIVIPLIRGNTEATECITYRDYFTFEEEFEYNCFNSDVSDNILYALSVRAASVNSQTEQDVAGFKLVFGKLGGVTDVVDANEGDAPGSDPEMIRMIFTGENIEIPGSGEVRTYVYNGGSNFYRRVEILPVLKSGRPCDVSDSIRLDGQFCDGSTDLDLP